MLWATLCWGSYAWMMTGCFAGWRLLAVAMLSGVSGLMLGFNVGHDAAHRVVTRIPWLDDVLQHASFLTLGIDPVLWRMRHIRSHHVYANVLGSDQDIDKNPFLRLSPQHPWKPAHLHQEWFAPLVYSLALLHSVCWGDWVYLWSKDYRWMRQGLNEPLLIVRFVLFKMAHFSVVLIVPWSCLHLSFTTIVMGYLAVSMVLSLLFVAMLVGTHFFDEAAFPVTAREDELPDNWAVHQLRTSCDWNPRSRLAAFLSGGANAHAMHHLFPGICHVHYRGLTPLLEAATARHEVCYNRKTLWEMIVSHFRFLRRMGKPGFHGASIKAHPKAFDRTA
jgi:linoleoyl-CoA desaturase